MAVTRAQMERVANQLFDQFSDFQETVTYQSRQGAYNAATGVSTPSSSVTLTGYFMEFSAAVVDGTNIQRGDRQFMILTGSAAVESGGICVDSDGRRYEVVNTMDGGTQRIATILHLRGL